MRRLPAFSFRDKVLLWLHHVEETSSDDAGLPATQAGIAQATGLTRAHASRTIRPLTLDGLVREERVRVAGFSRALLRYRLTPGGRSRVQQVLASLASTPVETRRAGSDAGWVPFDTARSRAQPPLSPWEAVRQLELRGHLDLESERTPVPGRAYAMELEDAPSRTLFVGRTVELAQLRRWMAGRAPLLALEGPAGIGKTTTLLHAVLDEAPRKHVLWLRLHEWTTVDRILGRIAGFLAGLGRPGRLTGDPDPDETLQELRDRTRGLPVLLIVDDVQKADPSVRLLLAVLARAAGGQPGLQVILSGRDLPVPGDAMRHAERIRVPPLSDEESEALVRARGLAEPESASVVAAAAGNPLFLEILARAPDSAARGSEFARHLFRDLAANLPPGHWETLLWAASVRGRIDPSLLARVDVGSPPALPQLARAGLLRARDDGGFEIHDIVRSGIYDGIEFRQRKQIHEALAKAYESTGLEGPGLAEYLHHLVRAGRREDAVRWVLRHRARLLAHAEERFRPPTAQAPRAP